MKADIEDVVTRIAIGIFMLMLTISIITTFILALKQADNKKKFEELEQRITNLQQANQTKNKELENYIIQQYIKEHTQP